MTDKAAEKDLKQLKEDECVKSFVPVSVSFADEIEGDSKEYNEIDVKFMDDLQALLNKEIKDRKNNLK